MSEHVDLFSRPRTRTDLSYDAVVVVPGIMGSALAEADTGRELWGMSTAVQYATRWRLSGMAALALTDDERDGRYGRIVPTGLLTKPAWAPFFGGFEPYGRLIKELRKAVVDRAAVCQFAYDWRLPVSHNGRLLADRVQRHLEQWRAHPAHARAVAGADGGGPAQVVIVAHSMGGLLATAMASIPGAMDGVRATLTLGTPFAGSVKTAQILNTGRGAPAGLPRTHLRDLGRTLPGLHDLLPTYRCLEQGEEVVALTPEAVADLGGDPELARDAFEAHARLEHVRLPGHRLVAGVAQPTVQSMLLRDGVVSANQFAFRRHADGELRRDAIGRAMRFDFGGDGTVYRYAAGRTDVDETPLVQQHAALAVTPAATDIACGLVKHVTELGEVLGEPGLELGLDVPDSVTAGDAFDVMVDTELNPGSVSCRVEDADSRDLVQRPRLARLRTESGRLSTRIAIDEPGLYRVSVGGGSDPVSALLLVTAGGDEEER